MLEQSEEKKVRRPYNNKWPKWDINPVTGCWLWTGADDGNGYGNAWDKEKQKLEKAHRVVYRLYKGAIPEGYDLDHLCRNRSCVNPDHLEPVTRATNLRRGAKTLLTHMEVVSIRLLYKMCGSSIYRLARHFDVSEGAIREIVKNRNWKGVE